MYQEPKHCIYKIHFKKHLLYNMHFHFIGGCTKEINKITFVIPKGSGMYCMHGVFQTCGMLKL